MIIHLTLDHNQFILFTNDQTHHHTRFYSKLGKIDIEA